MKGVKRDGSTDLAKLLNTYFKIFEETIQKPVHRNSLINKMNTLMGLSLRDTERCSFDSLEVSI